MSRLYYITDEMSFYGLLVKGIHIALRQREEIRVDEKDWVLMEAMNSRKLQMRDI